MAFNMLYYTHIVSMREWEREMQFTILCVGKIKESYFTNAIKEYIKRLGRYAKVSVIEVEAERVRTESAVLEEQIKEKEAQRLLKHVKDSMYLVALDLKGKEYDSVAFSYHISNLMLQGKSHIVFVIGGSLGLHSSVLSRADEKICFSKMTFPHQLMRVILLEQVYRAMRIMNHEPYHK